MHKQVLNYKYRLYLNKLYEQRLEYNIEVCRFLYNYFIKEGYDNEYEMNKRITELKDAHPELRNYHSKMLQMVSKQVASIYKSLKILKKEGYKVGKPKLKAKGEYNSFTYNQSGFKIVNRDNKYYLWLSKIGYIKIKLHREIIGNIKQVTIKRNNGKWYAILTVERVYPILEFINPKKIVSIDLGVKSFIVDSKGNKIDKQEPKRLIRRLKLIQRKISRRQKDSKNYKKAKKWYQIIHERIANRRKDFLHKISREYAKKYDVIITEDLHTKNMLTGKSLTTNKQNHTLHRHIQESAFRMFIDILKYKAKLLIKVNPKNTTKKCFKCGSIVDKTLNDRIHHCSNCNIKIDRDYNSALNILKRGITHLPKELGEVTLGEIAKLSLNQEAPHFNEE